MCYHIQTTMLSLINEKTLFLMLGGHCLISSCCNRKPDKFVPKLTKMLKSFPRTFKKILIHLYLHIKMNFFFLILQSYVITWPKYCCITYKFEFFFFYFYYHIWYDFSTYFLTLNFFFLKIYVKKQRFFIYER